jgi:AcrR family transcriptional regulator
MKNRRTKIARTKHVELHKQRAQQIVRASAQLIQEKGFQGMTLQDVADELDFTKAALYYYVQDKQDVLFRIFLQTLEMALETAEEIVNSAMSPPEKLRAYIDRQVRMIAEHPELFTVYFNEKAHLTSEHSQAASDKERQIVHAIAAIFQQGVIDGYFRDLDPVVATFAIMGVSNWVYRWYRPEGRLSVDEVSKVLQIVTLRGLELPT